MNGHAFIFWERDPSGGAAEHGLKPLRARLPDLFRRATHPRISLLPVAELFAQIGLGLSRPADRDFASIAEAESGCWSDEIAEALSVLLPAYEQEASLSALGRMAARWDLERCLTNLRRLNAEEARTPAILDERIVAPIIITGLPRTGSTFLHRLLAEDSENLVLRVFQTIYPYPLASNAGSRDRRPDLVGRQLRGFELLAPEMRDVAPTEARDPQECTETMVHLFQSLRLDTTHNIPSYRAWLDHHGYLPAYRFHKRFLQHLQHQAGKGRWILKSPDHVFALDAMLSVYPDARVVFLHRDPLQVIPSVAYLTEVLRRPFTTQIDRKGIGDQVTRDWIRGAANMVEASRSGRFPEAQILHLHYRDLVGRPLETIDLIYRRFGIDMDEPSRARIAQTVAARPNGGYGRNAYSFAAHGLDPDALRYGFRDYMNHFGLDSETDRTMISLRRQMAVGGSPGLA